MGITFPTLDYVVTMDSGYDQETIGDATFPVVAPLGINSLLQRIGRVGRRRPGIAYISREIGADFADLDDDELNGGTLTYEPIRFPMASAPLMPLAYFACKQNQGSSAGLNEWIAGLNLPSRLHEDDDRMEYLNEQINILEELHLADMGQLTPFGERMEKWIGRTDLAYTVQFQKRFEEGANLAEVLFWTVATALSNTPIVTLRAQHDFFVDYRGSHKEIPRSLDLWSGYAHEDLAVFGMVAQAATRSPSSLFGNRTYQPENWDVLEFDRWCGGAGIDAHKLQKAGKAIAETWKLFGQVNNKTGRFRELFSTRYVPDLATLQWQALLLDLPTREIHKGLCRLAGATSVRLTFNEAVQAFDWCDEKHGHTGLISQDDTPIRLDRAMTYIARVIPSRESKDTKAKWRLSHLCAGLSTKPIVHVPSVLQEQPVPEAPERERIGRPRRRYPAGELGVSREEIIVPPPPSLRDRILGLFKRK